MAKPEQIELDAYRKEIIADVKKLVDKYRAIFDWDIPDIDQPFADQAILAQVRQAIDDIERSLKNPAP